ncbi:MAG: hypothetical protein ABFS05_02690, partial [Bacteroidota bacterium]
NYLFTMDVLKCHGTPDIADYGGFYYGGGQRWMSGYDEWYQAMNNRISDIRKIYVGDAKGLLTLKHWLNDHLDGSETGGVASFIACSPWSIPMLPPGTPHAGEKVIASWCPDAVHGMTIVGYHDSIRYDYNDDGQFTNDIDLNDDGIINMKDWEIGAVIFANSYGDNFANDGYCFMMYKTLADDILEGGIWSNTVHIVDAKEEHQTSMTYKVSLEHNYRGRIRVQAGISSNPESNIPEHIHSYTIFNYQGGWHYMQGNDTTPAHKTIEFGLDVTPLLSYVDPGQACKFFLIIDERDAENLGDGQLNSFSLMDYTNGLNEIPCEEQNVPLVENGRSYFSVTYNPSFDNINIITEELPLYEAGQAMEVQLQADGGQEPYSWSLDKNYRMNIDEGEFTESGDHLLITNSQEDSMAIQQLEFSFPFYGNNFDTAFISSSGYVCFDENMHFWPYIVDMEYFLKYNRVVAPFLCQDMMVHDNLDNAVWYEGDETYATFRWRTTLNYQPGSSELNFAVTLFPDGNIDFYYGNIYVSGEIRSVSGIADGDYINFSVPELPLNPGLLSGTKVEFIALEIPDEISISEDGLLSILENTEASIKDIQVLVTDNRLMSAKKSFQLTEEIEISLKAGESGSNIIPFGQVSGIDLIIENRGATALSDIEFNLSCNHPHVQITGSQYQINNLGAGEILEVADAFTCFTDAEVADGQHIAFKLVTAAADKVYEQSHFLKASSPLLTLKDYTVLSADGVLDPGETADLQIKIVNSGSWKSINTLAVLSCDHPGISVNEDQVYFGTVQAGSIATAEVSISADNSIDFGQEVNLILHITDEIGLSTELPFSMRVGKVPVVVIDMDPGHNSAPNIYDLLQQMEVETEYTQTFPYSLNNYQSVILCLGIQSTYHEISYQQNMIMLQYLNQGGKIYMESRVNWKQDPYYPIFDKFGLSTEDHPGLYEVIDGVDSTFTEGLSYENMALQPVCYFRLVPVEPAYSILTGREYPNCIAVAHDAGTYKTIGTIFELGALIPSDTCLLETYMQEVLDFFGVVQTTFGIEEVPASEQTSSIQNFPNPFNDKTNIPVKLEQKSFIEAAVYDLQGRKIYELCPPKYLKAGQYHLSWDGRKQEGRKAPGGIYIYRLLIDGVPFSGKMILIY